MNISGYTFEGAYDHKKGFKDTIPAVYAIIDSHSNQSFLLDVGQTEDLNNRFPNHQRESCWNSNGSGNLTLWILRVQSEQDRLSIESQIRNTYNPSCGDR